MAKIDRCGYTETWEEMSDHGWIEVSEQCNNIAVVQRGGVALCDEHDTHVDPDDLDLILLGAGL